MATKKTKPVIEEVIEENVTPVEEPVIEEPKYVIVTAANLNVRKGPSKDTEILTVVAKDEKLLVNNNKLVKGFYDVTTASGTKGYVMKEFVQE